MPKTYFISGHRNVTREEFNIHYAEKIVDAIMENASFVVGDCPGVDMMAQEWLKRCLVDRVTVYHMLESPRCNAGFPLKGGFKSDVERDYTMTLDSDDDIAWVRPGCERSGTGNNLDRRKMQRDGTLSWENITRIEANRFL
jgi:hypothetical protein